MEEIIYHAKVKRVNKDGSILVQPVRFSDNDYPDEMLLHLSHTKMYDRFGEKLNVNTLRKNQWVKFITNGIMTMSLPPQLNPSILYEHIPMLEFEAEIKEINEKLTLEVLDDCGSFVEGKLKLSFFDEPIIFDQGQNEVKLRDVKVNDRVKVLSIVSFFTHLPLIEIFRLQMLD